MHTEGTSYCNGQQYRRQKARVGSNMCGHVINHGKNMADVDNKMEEPSSNKPREGCSSDDRDCANKSKSCYHSGAKAYQPGRVLRNRRYRRPFDDYRHTKRLFTPEIKRFLKGWLVRRRENPYPNRDEKKTLAVQTGLTYIQICNWFANWRRKLKNASNEAQQKTWGNLIKSYNTQAQGNVEQFSICSDDSIWEERDLSDAEQCNMDDGSVSSPTLSYVANTTAMDHSYSAILGHQKKANQGDDFTTSNTDVPQPPQYFQISSTTTDSYFETTEDSVDKNLAIISNSGNKYKNHIIQKYLRDTEHGRESSRDVTESTSNGRKRRRDVGVAVLRSEENSSKSKPKDVPPGRKARKQKEEPHPLVLSKWVESAARFQPRQNYVTWATKNITWRSSTPTESSKSRRWNVKVGIEAPSSDMANYWATREHHREELDAAEALTCLSGFRH